MKNKTIIIIASIIILVVIIFVVKKVNTPTDSTPRLNASTGTDFLRERGYTEDSSYEYQALGPGKEIKGTKYTIPQAMTVGTNLSPDTYFSIELINKNYPGAEEYICSANSFIMPGAVPTRITDQSIEYSVASSSDAAAGNRYDEIVYALPTSERCTAFRYFIHYGAIQNYPEGSVKEFDKKALVNEFDQIRRMMAPLY